MAQPQLLAKSLIDDAVALPSHAATAPFSIDIVRDVAGFLRLAPEWHDLVERADLTHPFLHHDWVRLWWDCFGAGRRLHLIVVRARDRVLGIAPLMSESAWMYGMPVRRLRLMHNDHTPRADFIVAERADEVYGAIWQTLQQSADRWDVVQLGQVPADSPTLRLLARLADRDGHATGIWHGESSPYVPVAGRWIEYAAGLSRKFRQNLRNRLARLKRLGEPALEIVHDPAALAGTEADALRLESSGWKRRAGSDIVSDSAAHRFYTALARHGAAVGLRHFFLTVGGRRIAAAWATRYRDRLVLLKTGYDPAFAACSPFKVLTDLALRDAWATGVEEFDFGGQAEPWKLEWTRRTRRHDWLFVFSRSRRSRLLHPVKFHLVPAFRWGRA